MPAITELAQIDASGHEQLKVSRLTMDVVGSGIDYSNKPEFTEAVENKVYYGPVYFRRESEPYMTISLAGARRDNGVSIAQVNLKLIWDVVSGIKVGEHGHAYVVDGDGRLIAHPDISLVLRNTDMSKLAQVQSARAGGSGEDVQEADDIAGHKVLTAYARVHPLGWFVFVETPIEEAYAPLYRSIQRTGYVLFGALGARFHRRHVSRPPHGGADPGVARRRRAHRRGRSRPAHRHQDRRRGRGARQSVQRYGGPAAGILRRLGEEGRGPHGRIDRGVAQQTATSEVLRVIAQLAGRAGAGVPGDAGERHSASATQNSAVMYSRRRRLPIGARARPLAAPAPADVGGATLSRGPTCPSAAPESSGRLVRVADKADRVAHA